MTGDLPSVGPAGPAGCGAMWVVLFIVILFIAAFVAVIWWILRDMGQV